MVPALADVRDRLPGTLRHRALNNAHAMQLFSLPPLLLVMLGLYECRARAAVVSVPRFVLRLPFVLRFTFTIARLPIGLALACQGQPSSEWLTLAASDAGRSFTLGCA